MGIPATETGGEQEGGRYGAIEPRPWRATQPVRIATVASGWSQQGIGGADGYLALCSAMGTIRTRSRCARPHFGQGRPVSSPPSRPEEREGIRGRHDSYAHEQNALGALSPPGRRGMRERAVTGPCPTAGTETPSRSGETAPADRPAGT